MMMGVQAKYKKIRAKCKALESKLEFLTVSYKAIDHHFLESPRGSRLLKLLKKSRVEAKQLKEMMKKPKEGKRLKLTESLLVISDDKDKMDPFQRLPEEIVEMILGHLADSKDFKNCSKTCSRFLRILAPTKTVWLFNEVLPLIANLDYVERPVDIVKLRQVCHEWKKVVDFLLENSDMKGISYSKTYKIAKREHSIRQMTNSIELVPLKFSIALRHFKKQMENFPPSTNPFLGKSLILQTGEDVHNLDEDDDWALITRYWLNARKFLKVLGGYVESCDLHLCVVKEDAFLRLLRPLCKSLPNVRKLLLSGSGDIWMRAGLEQDEITELEESLSRRPFPALPQLIHLTLSKMPDLFYKLIFPGICSQLIKLDTSDDVQLVFKGDSFELPKLTSLKLSCCTQQLFRLLSLKCPALTHLILDFKVNGREDGFRALLQTVQRFGLTLRELDIRASNVLLGSPRIMAQPFFACLQYLPCLQGYFPHLQILKVDNWFDSFDFLMSMPSLQYLVVNWTDYVLIDDLYSNEQPEELVEIHGYVKRLYQSNIWALLPNLMEVKLTSGGKMYSAEGIGYDDPCYEYTREVYEYHVKCKC